jgi:transketolase
MPSWVEQQLQSYRDEVLLPTVKARVAVEPGSVLGWIGMSVPTAASSA